MVESIGSQTANMQVKPLNTDKAVNDDKKDKLLIKEKSKHPVLTNIGITTDKFQNALTVYPVKGLRGSKNSNFYEFLTMGMVPSVVGSGVLIAAFTAVNHCFKPNAKIAANNIGRKMALGVIFYALAKNISKKFMDIPLKAKTGIDVNLPYRKVVNELPDSVDDKDLISHEYHKVFESVDFPRWDLLYDFSSSADKKNSYFDSVAKKEGIGTNLPNSDQIMKPKIKETIIKEKTFNTFAPYLWAAVGVGVANQKPWDNLGELAPKKLKQMFGKKEAYKRIAQTLGKDFVDSCKDFYTGANGHGKKAGIVGKALFFSALGTTLLGNFMTLFDFKQYKANKAAATPVIDDSKAKVVC